MNLSLVGMSRKSLTLAGAHCHSCYEIILNTEGSGTIIIGDVTYPFEEGSIHIIPPNVSHIKTAKDGFRDIFFQTDVLYPHAERCQKAGNLCLHDDAQKTMYTTMKLLFSRYWTKAKNDGILQSMHQLALQLLDDLCEKEVYDPAVEKIIHALTLSFNDPNLSVSDLLLASGYSKDHIRRLFTAATRMTPQEYLTDIRIRYAKKLLTQSPDSHLSVADIGAMCGYYDAKYFSRIFKAETGLSPTEYIGASAQKDQAPGH